MKKRVIKSFASFGDIFDGDVLRSKLDSVKRNVEGFLQEAKSTSEEIYDDYGKPVVDTVSEYGGAGLDVAEDYYDKYLEEYVDAAGETIDDLASKSMDFIPSDFKNYLESIINDVEGEADKLSSGDIPLSEKAKEKGIKASSDLLEILESILVSSNNIGYRDEKTKRFDEIKGFNNIVKVDEYDSNYNFEGRFCEKYLDEFVSAIGMKESSSLVSRDGFKFRKYDIKNPDSYATGFTQIMPYSFKNFYENTTGKSFKEHLRYSLEKNSPASIWMADKYYQLYDDLLVLNAKIKKAKKNGDSISYLYTQKKSILKEMSIIIDESGISDGESQETLSRDMMQKYFRKFGDWAKVAIAWYAGAGSSEIINFDENKLSDDYNEARIGYLHSSNKYSGVYTYSRKVMKNFKAILGSRSNSC